MHDMSEVNALLSQILGLAWEDKRISEELALAPRPIVEREALRQGASAASVAACVELLAKMPSCPDTFASRPDDLFLFHEHLLQE